MKTNAVYSIKKSEMAKFKLWPNAHQCNAGTDKKSTGSSAKIFTYLFLVPGSPFLENRLLLNHLKKWCKFSLWWLLLVRTNIIVAGKQVCDCNKCASSSILSERNRASGNAVNSIEVNMENFAQNVVYFSLGRTWHELQSSFVTTTYASCDPFFESAKQGALYWRANITPYVLIQKRHRRLCRHGHHEIWWWQSVLLMLVF